MKIYRVPVPDDIQEFFQQYAGILWFEERMVNLIAHAVNQGLWGKKK